MTHDQWTRIIQLEEQAREHEKTIDYLTGQVAVYRGYASSKDEEIIELRNKLDSLRGPDGIIRTFTVDPSCDFGDIDEG